MTLAELVKKILIDLNLSQEQLAERLNLSQSTVSTWLYLKRNPSIESLKSLKRFCDKNKIAFNMKDFID